MRRRQDSELPRALDELLADPLIQLVMKADNVEAREIEEVYRNLQSVGGRQNQVSPRARVISIRSSEDHQYRAGVGVMLLNEARQVFVGQRIGMDDAWQMPQGGIEPGEEPYSAALRELREEIGTDNVELLAESKSWLRYELPPELIGKAWAGRWRGQQQKWFAMRFRGKDAEIDIETEHPEFSDWRWVAPTEIAELIVSFKRPLYRGLLQEFQATHGSGGT